VTQQQIELSVYYCMLMHSLIFLGIIVQTSLNGRFAHCAISLHCNFICKFMCV